MAASVVRNLGRASPKTTALFLCDMQEKFSTTISHFDEVVQVSSRLLRAAKVLNMPIVVTEQYPKGLGSTVPELGLDEVAPDIVPIAKTCFSMVLDSVESQMRDKGIKSVVLCGIEAHACILQTALDLIERNFDVHVLVDACSSRNQVDRMFAFRRMERAGALLTTSEAMILLLLRDAKHPDFKAVQKFIMSTAPDSGLLGISSNL